MPKDPTQKYVTARLAEIRAQVKAGEPPMFDRDELGIIRQVLQYAADTGWADPEWPTANDLRAMADKAGTLEDRIWL